MKSQSLIVQFVLFFMIGLTIFLILGNTFKFYLEISRKDVIDSSIKLTNSFISSAIISATVSCKQCDNIKINLETRRDVGGYFMEIDLDNGLNISTPYGSFYSSIHNMNESIRIGPNKTFSAKPLTLTFDRINNKLMIK